MNLRILETLAVLATLFTILFGMLAYLNSEHAQQRVVDRVVLELNQKILDTDITRDNELRVYYKNKITDGTLDGSDETRLDYVEERLEHKYRKAQLYQEAEIALED